MNSVNKGKRKRREEICSTYARARDRDINAVSGVNLIKAALIEKRRRPSMLCGAVAGICLCERDSAMRGERTRTRAARKSILLNEMEKWRIITGCLRYGQVLRCAARLTRGNDAGDSAGSLSLRTEKRRDTVLPARAENDTLVLRDAGATFVRISDEISHVSLITDFYILVAPD